MPSVLIVSDSHGLTTELLQLKKQHKADCLIHCGDSELDEDAPELEGFVKVGGNCDADTRFPEEQMVDMEGMKLYVTHGHLYRVKMNLMPLAYRAEEKQARVVCFGHTHMAGAEKNGDKLFINPGSIRLPKNITEPTYAVMEWEKPDDIRVNFFTLAGTRVRDLTYHTTLDD